MKKSKMAWLKGLCLVAALSTTTVAQANGALGEILETDMLTIEIDMVFPEVEETAADQGVEYYVQVSLGLANPDEVAARKLPRIQTSLSKFEPTSVDMESSLKISGKDLNAKVKSLKEVVVGTYGEDLLSAFTPILVVRTVKVQKLTPMISKMSSATNVDQPSQMVGEQKISNTVQYLQNVIDYKKHDFYVIPPEAQYKRLTMNPYVWVSVRRDLGV